MPHYEQSISKSSVSGSVPLQFGTAVGQGRRVHLFELEEDNISDGGQPLKYLDESDSVFERNH